MLISFTDDDYSKYKHEELVIFSDVLFFNKIWQFADAFLIVQMRVEREKVRRNRNLRLCEMKPFEKITALDFPKNSGRGVMVKSLVQTEQGSGSPVQNVSVRDCRTFRYIQTGSHVPLNGFCIAYGERVLSSTRKK